MTQDLRRLGEPQVRLRVPKLAGISTYTRYPPICSKIGTHQPAGPLIPLRVYY